MASIKPHKHGWRAQVCQQGKRSSKTFRLKSEAEAWARELETAINMGENIIDSKRTLGDLLKMYQQRETPKKRSKAWEHKKLNDIVRNYGSVKLTDVDTVFASSWRDQRLKQVKSSTVNREWNLLSVVFNTAVREWKWLNENPLEKIKRPKNPKPRERLISDREIELITLATGFHDCPNTVASRVGAAFLFAIETAMRGGEILSLNKTTVDIKRQVCHLPLTKNGFSRDVPLSKRAVEILELVDLNFNLTSSQLDANFRKYRDRCMINDLHFHDTRHQAITNLANKGIQILDLAKITGITDLKMLMVYYNETIESIAKKLD